MQGGDLMPEFRIIFRDPRGVNIEAESEAAAREIVKSREWENGMDWDEGEIEIDSVEEF